MAANTKDPKAISLLDLQAIVAAEIEDSKSYIDSQLAKDRNEASEYYRGAPFGDEEEGRSQAISRDVHDTVSAIMPSLMRIFFGPDKVVEFVPHGEEDVEMAEQATDYVNYIFTRDNPGFLILTAVFKDALVRKTGLTKWWWDDSEEVRTARYSGLTDEALTLLLEDLAGAEKADLVDSEQDADNLLSVTVKLTRKRDRVRVCAVPPEEFLIDRNARSIDDATFVAHRTMKTVSDLVAMGYDKDEVLEASEQGDELAYTPERLNRNPYSLSVGSTANPDEASRLVLYIESYPMVDTDGDGIAELVKVCTIGPTCNIVHWEHTESRNFADFCPDPEPHTFFGQSTADKTMDVQRVKSSLLRSALDSLSLAINPRTVVSEKQGGENVVADAMNTEIGAIIRSDDVTAVQPIVAPDVSPSAFQAMNYMDQIKEARTGMSRVALGLDPQALQNTTATAAAGQFGQAQQHIELIARIFAETGMVRMFRGILRLVVENQRQTRMVQLTGKKFVPMDPRGWRSDMDVIPNVGIGGGTDQERAQVLTLVLQKQEQILLTKPDNPMVGLDEYHYTLSKFLQLAGFKNPDAFFKDPKDAPPAAPQPPPPDPNLVKVQQQGQLEQLKASQAHELAQAQAAANAALQEQEAARKHELAVREMDGRLAIEEETNRRELELKERLLVSEMELKRREVAAKLGLDLLPAAIRPPADDDINTDAYSDVQPGGEPG
ncbi:portal protein [Caulobacter rhizosphaerae]|uniref:portal protein n=1 Tax=Caulobacter rhizosphaerae TaxID=2010972 RepID=UPI0013D410CC|nr:hypothetical protein [Caulobacter rhizosphaerae]GGL48405.1 hypothetical protein GCM10010983_52190 [Caulobacter rhizosphaerae]